MLFLIKKLGQCFSFIETSDRPNFYLLLFLIFLGMILEVGGISLLLPLIFILFEPNLESSYPFLMPIISFLGNPSQEKLIVWSLSSILFYYSLKSFFLFYLAKKQSNFTYRVKTKLSNKLFSNYINNEYSYYLDTNSSFILRNLTTEISHLTDGILKQALFMGSELLFFAGVSVLLIYIDYKAFFLILIIIISGASLYFSITKNKLLKYGNIRQELSKNKIKIIQQSILGIKEIKVSGSEKFFLKLFQNYNNSSDDAESKQFFYTFLPKIFLEFLVFFILIILTLSLLYQDYSLSKIVTLLAIFSAVAFRILPSITKILHSVSQFKYDAPAIDLFVSELNNIINKNQISPIKHETKISFEKSISFKHVFFKFNNKNDYTLNDINLKINKGDIIGVVGESGSGKTTFINLLLGFLKPSAGRILIDNNQEIFNNKSWLSIVGYVPQSVFLIDDSFEKNIAFGYEFAHSNKYNYILKICGLDKVAKKFKLDKNIHVGEGGIKLSGGQIQRIGIARAIYKNPQILIFDESTSSLDSISESLILKTIENLSENRTIIIVSHKTSSLKLCNRIFSIKNNKITEQSTNA